MIPDEKCTTCHYFLILMPERYCGHPNHHKPIRHPNRKCADYINMLEKGVINRLPKKSFEETRAVMDADNYY